MKLTLKATVVGLSDTETSAFKGGCHNVLLSVHREDVLMAGTWKHVAVPLFTIDESRELGHLFKRNDAIRVTFETVSGVPDVPDMKHEAIADVQSAVAGRDWHGAVKALAVLAVRADDLTEALSQEIGPEHSSDEAVTGLISSAVRAVEHVSAAVEWLRDAIPPTVQTSHPEHGLALYFERVGDSLSYHSAREWAATGELESEHVLTERERAALVSAFPASVTTQPLANGRPSCCDDASCCNDLSLYSHAPARWCIRFRNGVRSVSHCPFCGAKLPEASL